jgi:pyrroloquinoline quinone biosynthesis protein B
VRAIVLGSAAGGGFPQWNCGCANCTAARDQREGFVARTQDSVAIEHEGRVVLFNASPDIHAQIARTRALWPRGPRHTPIAAIVLTNGDLDHVLGLFSLRESQPLAVYATDTVWRSVEQNAFVRTLRRFPEQLAFRRLPLDEQIALRDSTGASLDIAIRAFSLPGKTPVHCSDAAPSREDNVGIAVEGHRFIYAAACALPIALPADVLLFDGTFFRDDELIRQGLGVARASDMAHVPIEQSLALGRGRRIYTHINNSNPILDPTSAERRAVEAAGWEIAVDGLEIPL